jgi:hypothetical protein
MHSKLPIQTILTLSTALCSLLMGACGGVETQSFRASGNANIETAYIATDADFSQYQKLLIDDMGIFFPEDVAMSDDEIARIRQLFRTAFIKELQGYDLTQKAGRGMLQVSPSLIDLRKATYVDLPELRLDMRKLAKPGALLFLMELKDSGSGRVLARAGDSTAAPQFATAENLAPDWVSVEEAAQRWAALFRAFLDQNVGN